LCKLIPPLLEIYEKDMPIVEKVDTKNRRYYANIGPKNKVHPHRYYFTASTQLKAYRKARAQQSAIFASKQ